MRESKAFAPANISCIFSLYEAEENEKKGSLGVGFTIDKGVYVCVRKSEKIRVFVNGKDTEFDTVRCVAKKFDRNVEITIQSELPIGCGFGLSGASALATAYAINDLFGLKNSKEKCAIIAHVCEVECKSGRGDVGGQFNGGFMIKTRKEMPLEVEKLGIRQRVFYKVYGGIETSKVISDIKAVEKINQAGNKALEEIRKMTKPSFEKIIEISKEFALDSGLLRSERTLNDIELIEKKGGRASMIMLGEAVFSNIPLEGYKSAMISDKGAFLI